MKSTKSRNTPAVIDAKLTCARPRNWARKPSAVRASLWARQALASLNPVLRPRPFRA